MRKKKFLSLLLTFAMMMCLMPMKVLGEGTLNLYVTSDKSTAAPGDNITFTLKMGAVAGLTDIEFRVQVPQGLTLEENGNKVNSDFKDAMGEGGASLKVNAGVPKFSAFAETYYSNEDETTLGTLTYTVTDEVDGPVTISLIGVDANAGETKLTTTLTGATVTVTAAQVSANSVSLEPTSITLKVGSTQQLTATLTPSNATDTLNWSSNSSNATVNNTGLVTAVNVGLATITVRAGDNGPTATCQVTVEAQACNHPSLQTIGAVDTTCEVEGNNKYYYCTDCDKYFKDNNGAVGQETTVEAEKIPALGHNYEGVPYSNNDTQHWKVCSRCHENSPKENHNFGAASYDWSTNNTTCTASHKCTVCGKVVSKNVTATSQITPATCTQAGKTTYTANFTNDGFTPQTKEVSNGQPAGHDWDTPTYSWSADNRKCTATRTCKRDANHKEEETVNTSAETTATCTEAGTTTYTATFENEAFNASNDRIKKVAVDALGHNYQDAILQQATADLLGIMQKKCTRCGDVESTTPYIGDNICPNKCYQNDKEVYISEADVMSTEETATLDGKEVKIIVQDPLGVFADDNCVIEIEGITSDLGADYDGNISIEKAYKAKINLYKETVTYGGLDGVEEIIHREPLSELPGFVRLLLEIPDDPNDPNDDWDDDEIQVQRINIGEDTEYVERIEYQVYDADGNFVKVVEKGYVPGDGETLRKFAVIWTNHFSDYSPIDPKAPVKTTATTTTEGGTAQRKASNGLKTGESLNEVYLAGLLLAAAILVIYLSLKKRREA